MLTLNSLAPLNSFVVSNALLRGVKATIARSFLPLVLRNGLDTYSVPFSVLYPPLVVRPMTGGSSVIPEGRPFRDLCVVGMVEECLEIRLAKDGGGINVLSRGIGHQQRPETADMMLKRKWEEVNAAVV
jgi:hypothetical protein